MRSVDDEDARQLKRTGLNEPNVEHQPAVIVDISDCDRVVIDVAILVGLAVTALVARPAAG